MLLKTTYCAKGHDFIQLHRSQFPNMKNIHIAARHSIPRRTFLQGLGATIALPMLEAMTPVFAKAGAAKTIPRRMVAIETNMGIMPQFFFPEKAGRDYALTPYLEKLAAHRQNMTVFSGVSLPGVTGGHQAEKCFLTGTPHPDRGGFRNGVSLDQVAAEHIGVATRHPSLSLQMYGGGGIANTLSFTRSGAPIPADRSPRQLFQKLFVQGKPGEAEANVEALRQGRSMLDFVGGQTRRLNSILGKADQQRMEEYYTSVRELEQRLHRSEEWEYKPKPVVKAQAPTDIDDTKEFVARTRLMYDVMKLALETDSTRLITLHLDTTLFHNITHHGNRPETVAELRANEEGLLGALNDFLTALESAKEEGDSLLDRTQVLYGSPMGSANAHSNVNLPVLLAGGGFKHGQHLAFDTKKNYPLSNLYVSMLQRLGIETGEFSTAKGTMTGLEMV